MYKKMLGFCLVLVLALTTKYTLKADNLTSLEGIPAISLDQQITYIDSGDSAEYYGFTPTADGYYNFTAWGNVYATVYSADDFVDFYFKENSGYNLHPNDENYIYLQKDKLYVIDLGSQKAGASCNLQISRPRETKDGQIYTGSVIEPYTYIGINFTPEISGYHEVSLKLGEVSNNYYAFVPFLELAASTNKSDFIQCTLPMKKRELMWLEAGTTYTLFFSASTSKNYTVSIGRIANNFGGGSGLEDDPFLIGDVNQFQNLSKINYNQDIYFKLTSDLYLNQDTNYASWKKHSPAYTYKSIPSAAHICLDGDGHSIVGLYTKEDGLFTNLLESRIENLTITNFYTTGRSIIASYAKNTEFENVTLKKGIINHKVQGKKEKVSGSVLTGFTPKLSEREVGVGALAGCVVGGFAKNCTSNVTISSNYRASGFFDSAEGTDMTACINRSTINQTGVKSNETMGALAGICAYYSGDMDQCMNLAPISTSGWAHVGGLIVAPSPLALSQEFMKMYEDYELIDSLNGKKKNQTVTIINCGNTGRLKGICVGGLIYIGGEKLSIENSFNVGDIGYKAKYSNFQAGIITQDYGLKTVIKNVYNAGKLYDSGAGAIADDLHSKSKITSVFYRKGVAKTATWQERRIKGGFSNVLKCDSKIKALAEEKMKSKDFAQTLNKLAKKNKNYLTWKQNSKKNNGYPYLVEIAN